MTENTIRRGDKLRTALNKVGRLQSLPQNIQNVLNVLNNKSTMVEDVAREIGKDMAFSSQVLKLINSGFYGFVTPVKSIPHATVLLGFNTIKTLVTTTSMVSMFSDAFEGLWTHSLACARACSSLARLIGSDDPEEISVVGLLHDMGKVVLEQYCKDEFAEIIAAVKSENLLMTDAERRIIEITHADIAGWVLQKWHLPEDVVHPIVHHHTWNAGSPFAHRTAILHLADILVRAIGCGSGGDNRMPLANNEALAFLSIKQDNLPRILDVLFVELDEFI